MEILSQAVASVRAPAARARCARLPLVDLRIRSGMTA
jgi:hypothetical protein